MIDLSVVIVHYRDADRLQRLLRQLPAALAGWRSEVIVVDNASGERNLEADLKGVLPAVRLIANPTNVGFAAGVNHGVRAASGEILVVLNPDVELQLPFFQPLVRLLTEQPTVGVAGPAVFRPGGRRQLTAHRRFPNLLTVFVEYCLPLQVGLSRWWSGIHPHDESDRSHRQTHRTRHLTGVCVVTRRQTFLETGGFDERFFLYLEETDWQRRLTQRGREVWYCAEAQLTHFGSIAKRYAQASPHYLTSLFRYWEKWFGRPAVPGLRLTIWLGSVISLISLLPVALLAVFQRPRRRKLRLYFSGTLSILGWLLRPAKL